MEEVAFLSGSCMLISHLTYIFGTMWQFSRKKTNRTTKVKMGRPYDVKCEAGCTGRRVTSLRNRQRNMTAYFISVVL